MKRIDKFENQHRICREIDSMAVSLSIDYIEASLLYAERHDLEIDYIAELIQKNDRIRSKIELEAENLNFIKKKARLPI